LRAEAALVVSGDAPLRDVVGEAAPARLAALEESAYQLLEPSPQSTAYGVALSYCRPEVCWLRWLALLARPSSATSSGRSMGFIRSGTMPAASGTLNVPALGGMAAGRGVANEVDRCGPALAALMTDEIH
jgi:hypothetical protein